MTLVLQFIKGNLVFRGPLPESNEQQIFVHVHRDKRNQIIVKHFLVITGARIQSIYESQWLGLFWHNWHSLWFLAKAEENCFGSIHGLSISITSSSHVYTNFETLNFSPNFLCFVVLQGRNLQNRKNASIAVHFSIKKTLFNSLI